MDTKILVVGQKVLLESGVYCNAGTVVKATPNGVDVQTSLLHDLQHELLHFDKNGCSFVTELPPSYDSKAHPFSPWRWNGNGTYECGPWYIVSLVSDEELARWREAGARKDGATAARLWGETIARNNADRKRE
jgi:hypothetical protein